MCKYRFRPLPSDKHNSNKANRKTNRGMKKNTPKCNVEQQVELNRNFLETQNEEPQNQEEQADTKQWLTQGTT